MASYDRVTKKRKGAVRLPQEHRHGGLGLLLILAITAIGLGYVGYRLTLVFGVIS